MHSNLDDRIRDVVDAMVGETPPTPTFDELNDPGRPVRASRPRGTRYSVLVGLLIVVAVTAAIVGTAHLADSRDETGTLRSTTPPTGPTVHTVPDGERSQEVVGSKGTVLEITATHTTDDSGRGSTVYELAWSNGARLLLAQDDVCVGTDTLAVSTTTDGSGATVAVGVVPSWLENGAAIAQGGHDLDTERFRIEGLTDVLLAPNAVQGQPASLSGIDHDAVAARLVGCGSGGN